MAMVEQNMDVGFIFTWNHEEVLKIDDKTIKIVPFWKEALGYN